MQLSLYLVVQPEEVRVPAVDLQRLDGEHVRADLVDEVGVHALAHFARRAHRDHAHDPSASDSIVARSLRSVCLSAREKTLVSGRTSCRLYTMRFFNWISNCSRDAERFGGRAEVCPGAMGWRQSVDEDIQGIYEM